MILGDAVKRVKRETHRGDQSVTNDQTTTDILACLNDARRDVIRLLPLEWLRTVQTINTVIGTATYSLNSNCQFPFLIHYTNTNETIIEYIASEREFYLDVFKATQANAAPKYWLLTGRDGSANRQFLAYPTPDAIYSLNVVYYKDPTTTDMATLASAIPDIPSYLQDCVWKGGVYYFLKGFDDPGTKEAKMDYDEALKMIGSDNIEPGVKKAEGFGESTINDDNRRNP